MIERKLKGRIVSRRVRRNIPEILEIFSKRLKLELERQRISQQDLAAELGKAPSAITHWLNGASAPCFCDLIKVGNILNIEELKALSRLDAIVAVEAANFGANKND